MISVKDWDTLLTIVRLKSRIAISKEDSLRLRRLALALLLLGLAFSQTSTVDHLDEVSKVKCMGEAPKDFVEP